MATLTTYICSNTGHDQNFLSQALGEKSKQTHVNFGISGQIKRTMRSKLDGDETQVAEPFRPYIKTHPIFKDADIDAWVKTITDVFSDLIKKGATPADKVFIWVTNRDIVQMLNYVTEETIDALCNNLEHGDETLQNFIDVKKKLGARLAYQDPSKPNSFVRIAMELIGVEKPNKPDALQLINQARKEEKEKRASKLPADLPTHQILNQIKANPVNYDELEDDGAGN
tara:strand:+ start:194 stop:874 length:681 start_codon:yes stop_codon:yes gene_type:complete